MEAKSKSINYEQRIVSFIDILGFKEIIKESEHDTSKINIIYEILDFLKYQEHSTQWNLELIEIEEDAQWRGLNRFDITHRTNCTCFSDSIVVSVKIGNDDVNEVLSTLIANLSLIGSKLLLKGILIRGGISIGNLIHHDNGVIMGQSLIEVYELEKNISRFPRIILSNKLIEKLKYPLLSKSERYPYHQYLQRFEDGCVGFHQMVYFQVVQSWVKMSEDSLRSDLKSIKLRILQGLDSSFEHPEIYSKYRWLMNEYNELLICEDNIKENIFPLHHFSNNMYHTFEDKLNFPEKK
jgi:hypothetical protein